MRVHTTALALSLMMVAGAPVALGQTAAADPVPAQQQTAGPRLQLSTEIVDFGDVDDSQEYHQMVTLTNVGNETLVIHDVSATCGCTFGEPEKNELAPGESTQLAVKFNPERRSGEQHGKRVMIKTNDPTGDSDIVVKAFVIPRVLVEPNGAMFGQVAQGESSTVTIKVTGMTKDFKVTKASIDREDSFDVKILETKIVEREHPKTGEMLEVGETTLEVSMTADARIGRVDGNIRIETNEPSRPVINTTRAAAVVQGDISAQPGRISLSALAPGESFEQTVKIVSSKGRPFEIQKARFVTTTMSDQDREQIEISYEPLPEDAEETGWLLTVKGEATETMRIIQGSVVLMTDAPGQRIVRTQLTGVVRPQNAAR